MTALNRTLRDLCIRLEPVEALTIIDMAVATRQVDPGDLVDYAISVRPLAGASRLRRLAAIAAPAESPMETRLRWLLINAGLPHPQAQVDLRDDEGRFVGRADLFYPDGRLVVEYDGVNHRDRVVADNRRQNLLVNAGYRLLRFTASDLERPDLVVSQVRQALGDSKSAPSPGALPPE